MSDVVDSIPLYYKEPVFFSKQFWHPDVQFPEIGSEGNLVTFRASSDDITLTLVLLAVMLMVFSAMQIWPFLAFQFKHITYTQRGRTMGQTNISKEHAFQSLILIGGSLCLALLGYISPFVPDLSPLLPREIIIAGFTGILLSYFFLKRILYDWVNNTFVDGNNIQQWNKAYIFLTVVEMLFFIPVLLIDVFVGFYTWFTLIYVVFVVVLCKFLTLYKQSQLFFHQNEGFLQNILYFCALEVVPLLLVACVFAILGQETIVKL